MDPKPERPANPLDLSRPTTVAGRRARTEANARARAANAAFLLGKAQAKATRDALRLASAKTRETIIAQRLARTDTTVHLVTLSEQATADLADQLNPTLGRPRKLDDSDLIEDIEWMLQDTRWMTDGSPIGQVAERLGMTADGLRHKLTDMGQKALLERLRQDDAA